MSLGTIHAIIIGLKCKKGVNEALERYMKVLTPKLRGGEKGFGER
jgi:hypothetical protein